MQLSQGDLDFVADLLPDLQRWDHRPTPEDLAKLPSCAAVYLFVDADDRPVQLLTTQMLRRVAGSRLESPDEDRRARADLAEIVRGIRWRQVHSPLEARWYYYQLARRLYPREYRKMVSFSPAWFLHVDSRQTTPEIIVTERVYQKEGLFLGPWPTHRSAQESLEGLWNLFELCRYPEQVRKTPNGARCAYADMGRCDAPCDGSVPLEAYISRTRDAWKLAEGGVNEWIDAAHTRMRDAAGNQQYELAGLIKQQIAFAETWRSRWLGNVWAMESLRLVFLVPVTRRKAWKPFVFGAGCIAAGPVIAQRRLTDEGSRWIIDALNGVSRETLDAKQRMEQTWLVAHYLHHKESENAIWRALPTNQNASAATADTIDTLKSWLEQELASRQPTPATDTHTGESPTSAKKPRTDDQYRVDQASQTDDQ